MYHTAPHSERVCAYLEIKRHKEIILQNAQANAGVMSHVNLERCGGERETHGQAGVTRSEVGVK